MNQEHLEQLIRYHRWCYHEASTPEISDEAFDALYSELQERFPDSEVLSEVGCKPGSPKPSLTVTNEENKKESKQAP